MQSQSTHAKNVASILGPQTRPDRDASWSRSVGNILGFSINDKNAFILWKLHGIIYYVRLLIRIVYLLCVVQLKLTCVSLKG